MAKKATKSEAKTPTKTAGKADPFKTRSTKVDNPKTSDTITPPADVAEAIDLFRQAQDQAKHFEGEATVHKDAILEFCAKEHTQRLFNGQNSSFKVLGHESMVTYVIMDASAGLTEEDVALISERWGEKAADELIMRDFASIKFDAKVMEANYDLIVAALQTLPEEVLSNLFKPMLMKAKPGAVDTAKKYAHTPDQMAELIQMLKIKNYVR